VPGNHQQAWLEERLADLDNGDIPAICAAARAFPMAGQKAAALDTAPMAGQKAAALDTAPGCFERIAHRMKYAHFKKPGCSPAPGQSRRGANRSSRSAASCPG